MGYHTHTHTHTAIRVHLLFFRTSHDDCPDVAQIYVSYLGDNEATTIWVQVVIAMCNLVCGLITFFMLC